MQIAKSIPAGVFGTALITLLHEGARKYFNDTPRVELMGERAIKKFVLKPLDTKISRQNLYALSMAGDVLYNSAFYALIAGAGNQSRKSILKRSLLYGAAVGFATWFIPPKIGLGQQPTSNAPKTRALTIGMYILGGFATALAQSYLNGSRNADHSRNIHFSQAR